MDITIQKPCVALVLLAVSLYGGTLCQAAELQQCGQGNITVAGRTVGAATLWMQNCDQGWQQQDKRLRFNYTASIPGWAFKKAANAILVRNLPDSAWKQHKTIFEQITAAYQPIHNGDYYELVYQAGDQNMQLSLNGKLLVQVQHAAIEQYFMVWFGDKPFNPMLKKQLLG